MAIITHYELTDKPLSLEMSIALHKIDAAMTRMAILLHREQAQARAIAQARELLYYWSEALDEQEAGQ